MLENLDFSGVDLSGAYFSGCVFINVNFSNANLTKATFSGCDFDEDVNFSNANLTKTLFDQCDNNTDQFVGANLTRTRCIDLNSDDYLTLNALYYYADTDRKNTDLPPQVIRFLTDFQPRTRYALQLAALQKLLIEPPTFTDESGTYSQPSAIIENEFKLIFLNLQKQFNRDYYNNVKYDHTDLLEVAAAMPSLVSFTDTAVIFSVVENTGLIGIRNNAKETAFKAIKRHVFDVTLVHIPFDKTAPITVELAGTLPQ